ncbi:MAG: FAD-binding oxidoreductase [Actinobacteria bacterium]|nr:FAD-binding oxidoreductase [Actinomycetota bacterium]
MTEATLRQELAGSLRGDVLDASHPEYDEARALYNAMIDRRPRLIARCVDVADVIEAVRFGRESGLQIAVRGGGHSGAGLGSVEDGLVIDLSLMRGVLVDPGERVARVLGGTLLGEVDHATHAFGLAAPFGIISTTGVGGLTLGGGVGNLTRTLGLSVDSLLAADVVLADGSFVTATEDRNDDLFWALRGGGGNFGVVTSFTFRLSPVSTIVGGPTFWSLDRTEEILSWYREFLPTAPDELNGFFAIHTIPPALPFPEQFHFQKMCGVVWCYAGAAAAADEVYRPVRELEPDLPGLMEMPLPALNSAFDGLYPAGDHWYWRSDYVAEIPDAAVAIHADFAERLPTPKSTLHLYPADGAAARVASDATAFSYRDARWVQVTVGVDPDPDNVQPAKQWARDYWDALHPYSMGGGYVNMLMDEGQERVRSTYRENYGRLAELKRKYDPDNLFRVNWNISPD